MKKLYTYITYHKSDIVEYRFVVFLPHCFGWVEKNSQIMSVVDIGVVGQS